MVGLLIVGAGGHGRVVADVAYALRRWDNIAFLDDKIPNSTLVCNWRVIGNTSDAIRFREGYPEAVVAIGANPLRLEILKEMSRAGFLFPVLVHPDASVSQFTSIGAGTVICAQAAVIIGARIGIGVLVNTGASIGHDCVLEDGVHVSPGARLVVVCRSGNAAGLESAL